MMFGVTVLGEMERFKQSQAKSQFLLSLENRSPTAITVEQFVKLTRTTSEEFLQH